MEELEAALSGNDLEAIWRASAAWAAQREGPATSSLEGTLTTKSLVHLLSLAVGSCKDADPKNCYIMSLTVMHMAPLAAKANKEDLKLVAQGLRGCLRSLLENFLLKEAKLAPGDEIQLCISVQNFCMGFEKVLEVCHGGDAATVADCLFSSGDGIAVFEAIHAAVLQRLPLREAMQNADEKNLQDCRSKVSKALTQLLCHALTAASKLGWQGGTARLCKDETCKALGHEVRCGSDAARQHLRLEVVPTPAPTLKRRRSASPRRSSTDPNSSSSEALLSGLNSAPPTGPFATRRARAADPTPSAMAEPMKRSRTEGRHLEKTSLTVKSPLTPSTAPPTASANQLLVKDLLTPSTAPPTASANQPLVKSPLTPSTAPPTASANQPLVKSPLTPSTAPPTASANQPLESTPTSLPATPGLAQSNPGARSRSRQTGRATASSGAATCGRLLLLRRRATVARGVAPCPPPNHPPPPPPPPPLKGGGGSGGGCGGGGGAGVEAEEGEEEEEEEEGDPDPCVEPDTEEEEDHEGSEGSEVKETDDHQEGDEETAGEKEA